MLLFVAVAFPTVLVSAALEPGSLESALVPSGAVFILSVGGFVVGFVSVVGRGTVIPFRSAKAATAEISRLRRSSGREVFGPDGPEADVAFLVRGGVRAGAGLFGGDDEEERKTRG